MGAMGRRSVIALFTVLALPLAACASGSAQEAGDTRFIAGAGAAVIPVEERRPAPQVTGTTLDGDEVALADLAGDVVLVNFWASWCGPCAQEAPHLVAIANEYADRGVSLLGVNVKDRPANARTFERDFAKPYPSWHDEAGSIAASFGGIGPAALPSTLLLDAEHRVAVRLFGAVSAAQLSLHLDGLLGEDDDR
jgi:thiol-disulfide isomerase/thioredoxin